MVTLAPGTESVLKVGLPNFVYCVFGPRQLVDIEFVGLAKDASPKTHAIESPWSIELAFSCIVQTQSFAFVFCSLVLTCVVQCASSFLRVPFISCPFHFFML